MMFTFGRLACRLLAVALLGITAACAFVPSEMAPSARVTVPPSTIGAGKTIAFRFADDRDDETIGNRAGPGFGAKIRSGQLPHVVEGALRAVLEKKGFQIVPVGASADTVVVYRLRSFKFGVERSWLASSNAVAVLAVDARRNALSYDTVYRSKSEDIIVVVPTESAIAQQMNGVLSEMLSKAASDAYLDAFLAGG